MEAEFPPEIRASLAQGASVAALTPYRLAWIAFDGFVVAMKTLSILLVVLLAAGFFTGSLFFVGTLLMPVSGSQGALFAAASDVGNMLQTIITNLADLLNTVLECKEAPLVLWNTLARLVKSIVAVVYNTFNDELGFGLPTLYPRAERALSDLYRAQRFAWRLGLFRDEVTRHMLTIDPALRGDYLRSMRTHFLSQERAARFSPADLIPSQFCDVMSSIFDFIIDLLDIISEFVLSLLEFLITFFTSGSFDEDFLFIIVRFLIDEILSNIPFTECFIDPDALANTPVADLPALFASQTPSRLLSCFCSWRFKNPLNIPSPFANTPGGDPVPTNTAAAIVGCFCFLPNIPIYSSSQPVPLLIKCLGIDFLTTQFQNLYFEVYNLIKPRVDFLESQFSDLSSKFTDLYNKFTDLAGDVFNLRELQAGRTVQPRVALNRTLVEEHVEWLHSTMRREMQRQASNATYVEERARAIGGAMNDIAYSATLLKRSVMATRNSTFGERLAKVLDTLPETHFARVFVNAVTARFGEDMREHAQTVLGTVREIITTASWALRTAPTQQKLDARMHAHNFRGLVHGVRNIATRVRSTRGERAAPLRTLEASLKTGMAAVAAPARLPHVVAALRAKYGNDAEVNRGLDFAAAGLGTFAAAQRHGDLAEMMRSYGVDAAEVERMGDAARAATKTLRRENRRALAETFDLQRAFEVEWVAYRDWVTHEVTTLEPSPERIVFVAVGLVGASFTAGITVAGFVVGAGLTAAATLALALVPLLAAVALFFGTILGILLEIAIGVLINTMLGDAAVAPRFDFFSPYIAVSLSVVTDSFVHGYRLSDVTETLVEFGEISVDNLQWVGMMFIRNTLCNIPLNIPPYTCPRLPLVNSDARPDENLLEYILNAVIFCPQDEPCGTIDDCGGSDCVSPDTPSRICTVDAPCLPVVTCLLTGKQEPCVPLNLDCAPNTGVICEIQNCDLSPGVPATAGVSCPRDTLLGRCNCWPLIRERIEIPTIQFSLFADPDCNGLLDIDTDDLKYFNGPIFVRTHFSREWFFSSEFVDYARALLRVWYQVTKFFIRAAFHGGSIPWIGLFGALGAVLWFVPGPLNLIPIFTILVNSGTGTMNAVANWSIEQLVFVEDWAVVGPLATEALTFFRLPNYAAYPPFGKYESLAGPLACLAANIGPVLQVTPIVFWTVAIVVALFLSGALGLLVSIFFDIVLLPVNYTIFFARLLMLNIRLQESGMLDDTAPLPSGGALPRRAIARRGLPVGVSFGPVAPPQKGKPRHGIVPRPHAVPLGPGLVAMFHPNVAPRPARGRAEVLLAALVCTFAGFSYALTPRAALLLRRGARAPSAVSVVQFDEHVPGEHYPHFPYPQYLYSLSGARLDRDPRVVLACETALHQRAPDEYMAEYYRFT